MKRALVFFLLLALTLSFASAKNEIQKTRQYVQDRLQNPEKYVVGGMGSSNALFSTKSGRGGPLIVLLFDPDEVQRSLRGKGQGVEELFFAVFVNGCGVRHGNFDIFEEIYDWDDTKRRAFGILVMAKEDVQMNLSFSIWKEDKPLGVRNAVMYDFVRYFNADGARMRELVNYLVVPFDQIPQNHLNYMRNENGTFKFDLNAQNSLLNWHMASEDEEKEKEKNDNEKEEEKDKDENDDKDKDKDKDEDKKDKGMKVWFYVCWLDYDVNRNTEAGVYTGTYSLTLVPINPLGE